MPAALTGGSSAVHLGLGTDAATKQARRVSRTDDDFERALKTSEFVVDTQSSPEPPRA